MPIDPSEYRYEIEFDDRGRIRIKDPELAKRLLLQVAEGRETEILIETGPEEGDGLPLPPLNVSGCPKPINATGCPNPINGAGCPNSMCPLSTKLRIVQPIIQLWNPGTRD